MNDAIKGTVSALLKGKGSISFDYDLSLLGKSSLVYDHKLCRLACSLVTAGYDNITEDPSAEAETGFPYTQKGLRTVLDAMGFTRQELQPKAARDEESYFVAFRELVLDGTEYDLYVTAFTGSYKKTWFSNFDPLGVARVCNDGKGYAGDAEAGAIHLGFADARDFVHGAIKDFIQRTRTGRPIKLLIAGHSRGAATAGLLAAKIIENGGFGDGVDVDPDDVHTYCFAPPNYAYLGSVDVLAGQFRRIFNIVSPEDFVTEVFPRACGFGRYGTVYSIFGDDNSSIYDYAREKAVMTRYFSDYRVSRPYASYKKGNDAVRKVIAVMAEAMPDLDAFYNKKMRFCFGSCTPYEYFRDTLCTFVGGCDTPEEQAAIDRATKLLLSSALDTVGTCPALRKISAFFVFKQGIAGATDGKIGAEYFNDAHVTETYLAYLMSMLEDQLIKTQ